LQLENDMAEALAAKPSAREAREMVAAIARYIAQIDALREEMHRDDEAIDASSKRTDAILVEIAELLTDLRAA
jgi:uncharacterized coiled-coil DUF342 family protein